MILAKFVLIMVFGATGHPPASTIVAEFSTADACELARLRILAEINHLWVESAQCHWTGAK